jgi:hypothetical protein
MVHQLRTALPSLGAANQAAAELDSLLALARAAKEHRLVRPQLTEDNVLHITESLCRAAGLPETIGHPALAHWSPGVDVDVFDLKTV